MNEAQAGNASEKAGFHSLKKFVPVESDLFPAWQRQRIAPDTLPIKLLLSVSEFYPAAYYTVHPPR